MHSSLNKKEVTKVCPQGCCPTLLFINSSQQSLNNTTKPRNSSSQCRQTFATTTSSSIFPNTKFTNHECLPSLHESFTEFMKVYPQFSETEKIDSLRAKEYYHLSFLNQSCLDYIGIGLFSYYQRQQHDASKTQLSSSPSTSTPFQSPQQYSDIPFFSISYKTGNLKTLLLHGGKESEFESAMRRRIMKFLNISENDYFMVFTANRTSAFKLVADSYPFQSCKKLLTVYDYESEAVEAMISSSEKRGAKSISAEFSWPRLRIQSTKLKKMIVSDNNKKKNKKTKSGLFVFPLHSRVTGARYPYLWMRTAQENGWHVLIDACALGPKDMDSFGLSLFQPDFLICSFYKVFGENPSGFGCLFVKKSSISLLEPSTCAGIVNLVPESSLFNLSEDSSSNNQVEVNQKSPSILQEQELSSMSSFSGRMQTPQFVKVKGVQSEELKAPEGCGTVDEKRVVEKNQIKNVEDSKNGSFDIECRCLDQVDSLGLTKVTNRGRYLINWLVNSLLKLKHPNDEGAPLVKIYGPKIRFDRGPALAFNVYDWKGEKVEPVLVQKLADRNNISLSYGFLHHIWFADKYSEEKGRVLQSKEGKGEKVTANKKKDRDNLGVTVVTAALSFLANFEDVYKLWTFVARFLDADFVEKERWRYTALNQKTIEV
ncbi:molybdenum cofactor sulfurase-like protein [Trifolium pratense]|uniref:Molybdenum cofactor sulfurase-like protein n=1 Tax=Trifolium pratense TaxID=57577 RepID=A0A2K3L0M9_TRIPR|nr:molybdenum cofactor sulfurase [Trifolium pratense]PNX72092.1 molybdenum cofactor sulfurase-like protein [Trifolium pratense]